MSSNPIELTQSYDGRAKRTDRRKLSVRMRSKLNKLSVERAIDKVSQLIDSPDPRIALETSWKVIEQCIGRAPVRSEGKSSSKTSVDNRLQLAIQNLILPRIDGGQSTLAQTVAKPTLELASAGTTPQPIVGDPSSREGPPDE
jgi:hypothetical protein